MSLKDDVLISLLEANGEYISGERLSERFGVSRAAVWKAVNQIKEDGCEVVSGKNAGYRLISPGNRLCEAEISRRINTDKVKSLTVIDTLTSTNSLAKRYAEDGAPEGTTVIASSQSAGKGRLGKSFFSPSGSGLYLSVVLKPDKSAARMITAYAALAACRAIEELTDVCVGIKWVNDIYVSEKKVAGILTEASFDLEGGGVRYAVMGIGFNVFEPDGGFPEDLKEIAGYIADKKSDPFLREKLASAFLNSFFKGYSSIASGDFADEYRKRMFLVGRKVEALIDGEYLPCLVVSLDDDLSLEVEFPDGSRKSLFSGEVSLKIKK